jgi:hypothetical protein
LYWQNIIKDGVLCQAPLLYDKTLEIVAKIGVSVLKVRI